MASVKMVNTIKIFQRICIRIEFSSQRIEIFLFLTTNVVAIVVSRANQRKMDLLHNILSAVASFSRLLHRSVPWCNEITCSDIAWKSTNDSNVFCAAEKTISYSLLPSPFKGLERK